jgi:hypothetical protein
MRGDVLVINAINPSYWPHAAEIDARLSQGAFAKQPIVLAGGAPTSLVSSAPRSSLPIPHVHDGREPGSGWDCSGQSVHAQRALTSAAAALALVKERGFE